MFSHNFNKESQYSTEYSKTTKIGDKVVKEKIIKYCLQPSTNRDIAIIKPSKKFQNLIQLTTNELKTKQYGEFGNFKNFKKENVFTDLEKIKEVKVNQKKKEIVDGPKDLICLFSDDRDYLTHLIKQALQRLIIPNVFKVSFLLRIQHIHLNVLKVNFHLKLNCI